MSRDSSNTPEGKVQLPEEVATAVRWLNTAGLTMVADFLANWAEDKILAYEGLEGIKNGAFSRLEKAEHELEQQTRFKYAANERADKAETLLSDRDSRLDAIAIALDMPKDSWRIADCDVMAHQIKGLVANYIRLQDREIEVASVLSETGEKNKVLRDKVSKFADLKDNWDSYGARAFPQRTILLAMELAETLGPEWSTVPCADGPSVWLTRDDENDIIEVRSSYEE